VTGSQTAPAQRLPRQGDSLPAQRAGSGVLNTATHSIEEVGSRQKPQYHLPLVDQKALS
jgi:hypothetical protein